MKMSAGYELYQRNPRLAPTSAPPNRQLADERRDRRHLEVVRENAMAADVGQCGQRRGRHGKDADGQPVEPVGQVDGVRPGDTDERGEEHVDPAEIGNEALEERKSRCVL